MKRLLSLFLVLALVFAVPVHGSQEVFLVRNAEDLLTFAKRIETACDLDARLEADLDLGSLAWDPMGGHNFNGVDSRYCGEFDGNGHVIRNLTVRKVSSYRYLGLFEELGVGSYVHDLTLENIDIAVDPAKYAGVSSSAAATVGGIAAKTDGTIANCHVNGTISGVNVFRAGGIVGEVGYEEEASVLDCTTDVQQTYEITADGAASAGYAEVGGIAGSSSGLIDNCHARGDITLNGCLRSCGHTVGGVVAFSGYGDALVRNCSNQGDISAEVWEDDRVAPDEPGYGGICADYYGDSPMTNCFNIGTIQVTNRDTVVTVGGIAGDYLPGYQYRPNYDNCWSSGAIQVTDQNGVKTEAGFREDTSVRGYFVGKGACIGSYRGKKMTENALYDGSLTALLNQNRAKQQDNALLPWIQTSEGPRLITAIVSRNPFTDVPFDAFYLDSVLWAVEHGITAGTSATTFSPATVCQRAAVVTFLWHAEGCPEPKTAVNPFRDVAPGDFYYKAVLWALEEGITSGTSADTFSPLGVCNRAQVVTFLYRAMGSPGANGNSIPFRDVAPDQWYTEPVLWAAEQGITSGMGDGTFGVGRSCNRAQIVTFLFSAYNN